MVCDEPLQLAAFPTDVGWMAMLARDATIQQIVCAHPSATAAVAALDAALVDRATEICRRWQWLIERLQDFAAGRPVDFADVPLALDHLTPFKRRVVRHCRAIPYGHTLSYGELAARAGSPRAARAVGSTMATNRFSLVIPCHRVINADGSPGRYGSPAGARTKCRLLEIERRGLAALAEPKNSPAPERAAAGG